MTDGYPSILYFSSPLCGPCHRIRQMLDTVNVSMFGNKLVIDEINILEHPEKAEEYQIHSMPTVIIGDRRMSASIEQEEIVDAILQAFLSSVRVE